MPDMAAKQGLKRLMLGTEKKITPSEANRGYFFVTHDKLAIAMLGNNKFDVAFGKYSFSDRHIDSYGRISLRREVLREFQDKTLFMKIEGKGLVIKVVKS